jgi:hypothetical protein
MPVHTRVDNFWNHTGGVVLRSTTSGISPAIPTPALVAPQVTHNPKRVRPALTPLHPQLPQDLILLLIYLHRFLLEEAPWGQRITTRSRHVADRRCHPDRLAFKMDLKALRWFFDSRYGRCSHVGGPGVWAPRNRWLALGCELIEGTLWTWRQRRLVSPI